MRLSLLSIACLLLCVSPLGAQEFSLPESIVWDDISERYLVSNSGDGQLKSVKEDGSISFFGLEAKGSHGLVVVGGRLYACYRSSIHVYNLRTEELVDVFSIPTSKFLNGLCADGYGNLYVTDFTSKVIFRVALSPSGDMKSVTTWKQMDRIPNGIAYHKSNDEILVLTWGRNAEIISIDRVEAKIKLRKATDYDNLEAICIGRNGDVYVSAWGPNAILHFENGISRGAVNLELPGLEKPTGLCLSKKGDLLHLSSTSKKIEGLSTLERKTVSGPLQLATFPNPISNNTLVSYDIEKAGMVNISVYDCRGGLVERVLTEQKSKGHHQFLYDRGEHPNGLYFIHIQSDGQSQAMGVTFMD